MSSETTDSAAVEQLLPELIALIIEALNLEVAPGEVLRDLRADRAVGGVGIAAKGRGLHPHVDVVLAAEDGDVVGRERDAALPAVLVLSTDSDHRGTG